VRRHTVAVAAAVAILAVLSGALFVANRERLAAERRFGQLRQLASQVFALDEKIRNLQGAVPAREALVSVSLEYLEGLAADAGGDIELMQEISEGYFRTK